MGSKVGGAATHSAVNNSTTNSNWSMKTSSKANRAGGGNRQADTPPAILGKLQGEPPCEEGKERGDLGERRRRSRQGQGSSSRDREDEETKEDLSSTAAANKPASPASKAPKKKNPGLAMPLTLDLTSSMQQ